MSGQRLKIPLMLAIIAGAISLLAMGVYILRMRSWVDEVSRRPSIPQPGGALIICGGGLIPDEVHDRFLELAGGKEARLVVIPAFAPSPQEAERLLEPWRVRGPASVVLLHATSREQCDQADFIQPLTQATGVWMSGGSQSRLSDIYVGTKVEQQLHAIMEQDGVVGGFSAGAAIMSRVMIGGGYDEIVEKQGFDLLPDAVIDQHFFRRNRVQRLLGLLTAYEELIGLGIDERTAVLVQREGKTWTVIGDSYAMVCVPVKDKTPRIEILKPGDEINIDVLRETPRAINSPMVLEELAEAVAAE
jgi:cyanophycinase